MPTELPPSQDLFVFDEHMPHRTTDTQQICSPAFWLSLSALKCFILDALLLYKSGGCLQGRGVHLHKAPSRKSTFYLLKVKYRSRVISCSLLSCGNHFPLSSSWRLHHLTNRWLQLLPVSWSLSHFDHQLNLVAMPVCARQTSFSATIVWSHVRSYAKLCNNEQLRFLVLMHITSNVMQCYRSLL